MRLLVQKLHPEAQVPTRANGMAIGLDVYAHLLTEQGRPNKAMIPSRNARLISTGIKIAVALEQNKLSHYVQVVSRSGMALKSIFVANAPGIIDPDYTGELGVILYNGGHETYWVQHGDRIAQLIIAPIVIPDEIITVDVVIAETDRGAKGFGSTGR